jgi:hypothetical protein
VAASKNQPPAPVAQPTLFWNPATGSYEVDDAKAQRVLDTQAGKRPATPEPTPAEQARLQRVNELVSWGVGYQEACLVTSDEHLRLTQAIQHADYFLVGRGAPAGDGAGGGDGGDQRDAGGRKKTLCVFSGTMGTGKTTAAAYLVSTGNPLRISGPWTRKEHPRFLHVDTLFAAASLVVGGEADLAMRKELASAQILAIDDLGAEKDPRKKFLPYLEGLINARYSGAGWTILTTNLPLEAFRAKYGERIYDRLKHRAEWYELKHESLRGGGEAP